MIRHAPDTRARRAGRDEEGALLIILMVAVAAMMVGVAVAAQAWSITWRRDSEEELIFRGQQYVQAILLYRKEHNGQFPTNLEDLMKPGPRQVRYIRKLFRDPINPGGQWGLLYLMPGGNAIYDPVAAQKAQQAAAAGKTGRSDDLMAGGTMFGVTPITGPMASGMGGQLMAPGMPNAQGTQALGQGQTGLQARGLLGGGATGRSAFASGAATRGLYGAAGMQQGGLQGIGAPGMGFPGAGTGVLPGPKPGTDFDADSPSEPPIGWPIVGVISRASTKLSDDTYKIYRGHDKIDEWQFHVFDQGFNQQQAPQGVVPGGSQSPFIGPGFGGHGLGLSPGMGPRPGGAGSNWPQGGYNQRGGTGGRQMRQPGGGGGPRGSGNQ